MTSEYEAPDVLEVGDARQLTLGNGGPYPDNCNCTTKHEEEID